MSERRSHPIIVFADDWGRHPSSCQHLIQHLLQRHRVYWINTIGTRQPGFDRATLARAVEKLRQWTGHAQNVHHAENVPHASSKGEPEGEGPRPCVLKPIMWPWFTSKLDRRFNRILLERHLHRLIRSLPAPPIILTTVPIVADLVGRIPAHRWVYYCVDDFGQWPGLDHGVLDEMEQLLVQRVDTLIAVSEHLRDRLARMRKPVHLLTHGINVDDWFCPPRNGPANEFLKGLEPPFVIFWGLIDQRMDSAFLKRLADDLRAGTIVLVGPVANPDSSLQKYKRVAFVPALPHQQLPRLASLAKVLIMPYADLPVTRAMQPLKLKEYLATGKPAVVRSLPSTRPWADCLDLAETAEQFSELARLRLQTDLPEPQRMARARLVKESWAEKANLLEQWALDPESVEDAVVCH